MRAPGGTALAAQGKAQKEKGRDIVQKPPRRDRNICGLGESNTLYERGK